MFSAPPPNSGVAGLVEMVITVVWVMCWPAMALRSTVLGSVSIAWVMVPAAMKLVRSCGIRAEPCAVAVWLAKGNLVAPWNGVMSTGAIVGGPLTVNEVPCASTVVPCGIEAIRATSWPSFGSVVGGTQIHRPGSRWIPVGCAGLVTSLIDCR